MRADDFIKELSSGITPVRPLPAAGRRACLWGVTSLLLVIVLMYLVEPISSEAWQAAFQDVRWILRLIACAALVLLSTWGLFIANVPGNFSHALLIALGVAFTLVIFSFIPFAESRQFIFKRHFCVFEIFFTALMVSAILSVVLRAGFPSSKRFQSILLWLSSVSIALLPMEGSCVVTHAHSLLLHLIPVIVGAGIGINLLSRKRFSAFP